MNPALALISVFLFFVGAIAMDFPWPKMLLALPPWFMSGFFITICIRQYARDKAKERNPFLVEQQGGFARGALWGLALAVVGSIAAVFLNPFFLMFYGGIAFVILPLVMGTMSWLWRRTGMPQPDPRFR